MAFDQLIACDFSHDHLQLISPNGQILDRYMIRQPYGVCRIDDETFAVTSVARKTVSLFRIKDNSIKFHREYKMPSGIYGYGISFTHGVFAIACHSCVQIVNEKFTDVITVIGPLQRRRHTWFQKQHQQFAEASYVVADGDDSTMSMFVSDYGKDRVTCLRSNGSCKWKFTIHAPRGLLLHGRRLYVAAKRRIVLLTADTGQFIKEIKEGVPKCPMALTYVRSCGRIWMTAFNKQKSRTQLIQSISIDV